MKEKIKGCRIVKEEAISGGGGGGKRSQSPKVQESQGLWVQRSKGFEDQDISNSNSNTSLTLKKVHLVNKLESNVLKINFYKKNCSFFIFGLAS